MTLVSSDMFNVLSALVTSFAVTFFAIPSIIRIAELKHLFDEPGARKSHDKQVPTLGGVAIFAGLIFSLTFWASQRQIVELQYIISAILVLFFIGIKDDLYNLVAYKKLVGQLISAFILVHWAQIKITTFYGLFGIWDLTVFPSYALSIFTIVVITNSFNLIDGVNTLAGSIGIISAATFGTWFFFIGSTQYSILAFALVGALLAFLWFNRSPAKIFMGDTGSLIVGMVLSLLAIKFIEMNRVMDRAADYKVLSVPVVTIGILVIPLFDTLRVFAIRIYQGHSPLHADRNHLHHMLLDLGLSHMQTSGVLVFYNLLMISFVFAFQSMKGELLLLVVFSISLSSSIFLTYLLRSKKKISGETLSLMF
jgi:UDP-GlcNAc:undecaprenyl-phosphate GlcNAc-1-phosphate transferase